MIDLSFRSTSSTSKHQECVCDAFLSLLKTCQEQSVNYIMNYDNNHYGFQHKIFQEYIKFLEKSFPYSIIKNRKVYRINDLLNENLCIFDGESDFEGVVGDNLVIKNETKEFYIGGRKASYTRPYYIGKLISILDIENNKSLFNHVEGYSFHKINMKNIKPGKKVLVKHLRIPPHYQMGGMVYVNRVRKKIVDLAKELKNEEIS